MLDKASSPVTSMIAAKTADAYEFTLRHFSKNVKSKASISWISHVKAKMALYTAIAHFHAPLYLPMEQNVGERIVRLKVAKEHVTKACQYVVNADGLIRHLVTVHLYNPSPSHL